ncbi:MAG: nucleotidyltransferase domain-containing protein [Nanoarchaeota archaeon]
MKTIMSLGCWRIVSLFSAQKSARIHLREIARKSKLNENSASIFLHRLEKTGILSSQKDGNLKKYSLQPGLRTYALLAVMDVERFSQLPSLRRNAITCFLDKLPQQPVFVILFGSTAHGNFSKESDIDVILAVNSRIPTKHAVEFAESQTSIIINPLQLPYRAFRNEIKLKKDQVIQAGIHTGYPLTNHINYYQLYHNETGGFP